jgi:class 3 adenylate cyclase
MARKLTAHRLAVEAGAGVDQIHRLVEVGVLTPAREDVFGPKDVYRVQEALSYVDAGLSFQQLRQMVAMGLWDFQVSEQYLREPAPPSGLTFGEFVEANGLDPDRAKAVFAALSLPPPERDDPMRIDDEDVLRRLFEVWDTASDPDAIIRAARLLGEAVRLVNEGWIALFTETVGRTLTAPEATTATIREGLERSVRAAELMPSIVTWLQQRELPHALRQFNVETIELRLAEHGLAPHPPDRLPAIAFVDLSGYTATTERRGDEAAIRFASILRDRAEGEAGAGGGRLVKLLGDGAMLFFPSAEPAVAASVRLIRRLGEEGLLAHAGVSSGPVVERDRDYFGHTVNLASRISSVAGPGEVLVTEVVAAELRDGAFGLHPLGPTAMKGLAAPISLFRVDMARA